MTPDAAPFGAQSMVAPLLRVAVKRPEEAFRSYDVIAREWMGLGYTGPPDLAVASSEHARLVAILREAGARVICLPSDETTTLDSLYVHDPILVTERGAIVLRTGKEARRSEGPAFAPTLADCGIPVLGEIVAPGTGEAGDMVWVDRTTLLVGQGFRTNEEGIRQLRMLLTSLDVDVIPVHLPYANGPGEVLHLMSFLSLVDTDLAVIYRPLVPVPLFQMLEARGFDFVDVPEEEYPSQGPNVLALRGREVVVVEGNAVTRRRLEAAGCTVHEIAGDAICFPGAGGPTCLTRPLLRG